MLTKFKDKEGFVENIGLSRSIIYFKVRLYKLQMVKKVRSSKELKFFIKLF